MQTINRGKFITFEGGEGCGKSTQSKLLYQYLESKNIPVDLTREIGGTATAEKMREILVHQELLPMSELLLIMTARYEHLYKRIIPKLNSGIWVICDRFIDSTACYQGQSIGIDRVYDLHNSLISTIMPDCTFWIDINPNIALPRSLKQGDINKFEHKDIGFHQEVYNKFQYISSKFSDRIIPIQAADLSIEKIHRLVITKYRNKFKDFA